jgi:hypothetical protein
MLRLGYAILSAINGLEAFCCKGHSFGFRRVLAHSLVQIEDGSLIEITSQEGDQLHPFVRHLGTDHEFEEFADRGKLIVRP